MWIYPRFRLVTAHRIWNHHKKCTRLKKELHNLKLNDIWRHIFTSHHQFLKSKSRSYMFYLWSLLVINTVFPYKRPPLFRSLAPSLFCHQKIHYFPQWSNYFWLKHSIVDLKFNRVINTIMLWKYFSPKCTQILGCSKCLLIQKLYTLGCLKVPGPIASDFFSNFQKFWYQKKAHIFLITPGEFYSWKLYCLEDIMKMWLVMVTIIKLTQ